MNTPLLIVGAVALAAATSTACGSADDDVINEGPSGDGDDGAGGETGDGDSAQYMPVGEPCDFGEDADKCDGDESLACTPVFLSTGEECTDDDECGNGELCLVLRSSTESIGQCGEVTGECLARCGSDADCDSGSECEISTGECVANADNSGSRFGESCEEDSDCAGRCIEFPEGGSECEEFCRVGATSGCGEEDLSESNIACAYFAFDFDEEQGEGDLGICAQLCDCTAECPGDQKCLENARDGYLGVCTGGDIEKELTECPGGMGGSGN